MQKGSKNIDVFWFPVQKSFDSVVIDRVKKLRSFGFSDDDALFSNDKHLKYRPSASTLKSVPVMTTQYAITRAFAIAILNSKIRYTPHAVKHSIGAERDMRPLTQLERKAWSEDMGHESEQTTERHYGRLPDEKRFEVLENVGKKDARSKTMDISSLSENDQTAILESIFNLLKAIET